MRVQLRRIEPKRAAWFILIAALVAAAAVAAGREAGIGRGADAGGAAAQEPGPAPPPQSASGAPQASDSEPPRQGGGGENESTGAAEPQNPPLALTLSAPETCETGYPQGSFSAAMVENEDGSRYAKIDRRWETGTRSRRSTWLGRRAAATAPTRVKIAGESRTGASGTIEVSCAMSHGPVIEDPRWGRILLEKHVVDSGLKTITGSVVDGAGAAAEAGAEVYVIVNRSFALAQPGGDGSPELLGAARRTASAAY